MVVERLDEKLSRVETADGSSYRRNGAHLKKTNESRPEATSGELQQIPDSNILGHGRRTSKLPPDETLTDPPQMSNFPDEPDEPSPCEESGTKGRQCIEPYKEQREPDLGTRTQSGRLVTRPSYLKDFIA